jgi:hypothetical protein
MTRTWMRFAVAAVAALALATGAAAAAPSPALLTLQAADLPGAKVASQGSVKEPGYLTAYQRTFQFTSLTASGLIFVQSEAAVAPTAAKAAADLSKAKRLFASKGAHALLVASVAKDVGVKPKAVKIGAARVTHVGDQGFSIPVSVQTKRGRVYENIAYFRIDAIVGSLVQAGVKPITIGATSRLEALVASHIGTALAPAVVSPPTITGTAQQGQTLTATPGTWNGSGVTFTYQWQRCDSAGANCVDIPGATTPTYVVSSADPGATLRVTVKATNRFGSVTSSSAQTAVVT